MEPPIDVDKPSPTETLASRLRQIRQRYGWTAKQVAARCADAGMPELSATVLLNIETGRRTTVTVDQAVTLAWALNISVVDLLVPTSGPWRYLPGRVLHDARVGREWARASFALPDQDVGIYWREQPEDRWEPPEPGMRRHMTLDEMRAFFGKDES